MLGKMTALEAVFHPELHGSGIALSDLEVLQHSAVQKVADTSQGVRAQISMVEGSEEIFSEFDFAFAFNLAPKISALFASGLPGRGCIRGPGLARPGILGRRLSGLLVFPATGRGCSAL